MTAPQESFLSLSFLRGAWGAEYNNFCGSKEEEELVRRLKAWSNRLEIGVEF